MPFDPVSVVGIVGTTAGLMGFLASTVENISIRLRDFDECVKRLKEYHHTIEATHLEILLWSSIWSRHRHGDRSPYEEQAYTLFWGKSGFESIVERLRFIQEDFVTIVDLLGCRNIGYARIDWKELGQSVNCPTEHDVRNWCHIMEGTAALRHRSVRYGVDWTYRFLFAISKNAELKSRINRLQDRVNQLQKTSIALYRQQHEARTGEPTSSQLTQVSTLQKERRNLLEFLDELFQDNFASELRWALELGNPSLLLALSRLRGASRVQIKFVFKAHLPTGVHQHDIKIPYPMSCKLRRPRRLDDGTFGSGAIPIARLPGQYCCPKQLQLELKNPLDVQGMSTYALAAVASARSTILLYKSTWVDGLCFCGIGVYNATEGNGTVAYFPREDCTHIDRPLRKNVFLLLAVLLAELAFGAPIQVHVSPWNSAGVPVFKVPETHLLPGFGGLMTWENLSELLSERMYECPEHFVSVEYLEAMDFCYELSQRLLKRNFVDDDLDICINRIETPLKNLYENLAARSRELVGLTWYQRLASGSNMQVAELPGSEAAAELE